MVKTNVTREQRDIIIYNYLELGWGRAKCGKQFGIGEKVVKRVLEEEGITLRTKSGCGPRKSTYKMNDNYLKNMGRNQAYFIGFIASDGNISGKDNRVELELQSIDADILESFRLELELEREIKVYNTKTGYVKNKLYFYSAEIKRDLLKYGIVPNKTYNEDFSFPHQMPKEYIIDYIRGFFDGDGSVKATGSNNRPAFQIDCTNLRLLKNIQRFLQTEYCISTSITSNQKTNVVLYRLYAYADDAEKIFELMYNEKEQTLYLPRKYNKYQELLQNYYS